MDYHVVIYSKYELVGYPLPSLWHSFSLRQKALYYLRQVVNYNLINLMNISPVRCTCPTSTPCPG